jgi:ATP-dependent Lhr-like helicase
MAALESGHRAIRLRIAAEERWVAIEDAARFRDALGAALPVGVPVAFLEPVADPLADLVSRFARTHGPFVAVEVAARLGIGVAVAEGALRRLAGQGRVLEGEFRPGATGREWVDAEVLRRLRRRSLAALRREVEPVPTNVLGRFLGAWQGVGQAGPARADVDALYRAIEQLQGAAIPASVLERLVLPSRLAGYAPHLLDQLTGAGEVVWAGVGAIGSDDGWISLALAERAPVLLPDPPAGELSDAALAVREALVERGAMFFRQLADALRPRTDAELLPGLWELVWAGVATNDSLVPLRALVEGPGRRRSGSPRRGGSPARARGAPPAAAAGRWGLLPPREPDATRRAHAVASQLLARHGVLTRGAVIGERIPGGFAAVYPVLKAMEESGRCRRGYFVEGLGGAQFALPGAVDRLRAMHASSRERETTVLAAADPANPFGAAVAWPERDAERAGHRPGRKAGAVVVLVDGSLVVYVERGGRTMLTYSEDPATLQPAIDALALAVRDGLLGRVTVERADGEGVFATPLASALAQAGFRPSTRGLRLRG